MSGQQLMVQGLSDAGSVEKTEATPSRSLRRVLQVFDNFQKFDQWQEHAWEQADETKMLPVKAQARYGQEKVTLPKLGKFRACLLYTSPSPRD